MDTKTLASERTADEVEWTGSIESALYCSHDACHPWSIIRPWNVLVTRITEKDHEVEAAELFYELPPTRRY